MKTFKESITEGKGKGSMKGDQMESVIVNAFNGNEEYDTNEIDSAKLVGKRIKRVLVQKGVKGKAEKLDKGYPVSKRWMDLAKKHHPKPSTMTKTYSKTDFTIGKDRISLKSGNVAQITSGNVVDGLGIFITALEKSGTKVPKSIINSVKKDMADVVSTGSGKIPMSLTRLRQTGNKKNKEIDKIRVKLKSLNVEMKSLLSDNKKLNREFAREAMSGMEKFGPKSRASATHFLATTFDGTKVQYHSIGDNSYVDSIASRMNLDFSFKTGSIKGTEDPKTGDKSYRFLSTLRLGLSNIMETQEYLESNVLTENKAADLMKKAVAKVKDLFSSALRWASSSISNMLYFLGMTPQVKYKDDISFFV